jgi:hypothetical protein
VPFVTTSFNKHTVPNAVTFEVTGLTNGDVIYWKFYGRTNTSANYAKADAITEVKTNATSSGCTGNTYSTIIVQNNETTSITITAIDNGVEKTYPAAANSQVYLNGCICEDITATGDFTIITRQNLC